MVGHVIDENTYALWTFNSGSLSNSTASYVYATDATGKGSFALTQSTESDRPLIIAGPDKNRGQYARWFDGSAHFLAVPMTEGNNAADMADVTTGSFTLELWVYPYRISGDQTLIDISGAGEGVSTNITAWWYINSSGQQEFFWEHSGGTNVLVVQASGDVVTAGEWQHLAVAVEAAGGTRTVSFYRNGVFLDDGSDTNSDGDLSDSSAIFAVGERRGSATGGNFRGTIGDIRISNIERSSAEILASYNTSPRQHEVDANTFLHYPFNEEPFVVDELNNIPLGLNSAWDLPAFSSISLCNDGGQSLQLERAGVPVLRHPPDTDLVAVMTGSWTVEFWYLNNADGFKGIMGYRGSTSESEDDNYLCQVYYDSSERIDILWEYDAGTNVNTASANPSFELNNYEPTHLALVKDVSEIDGTVRMLTYINAELIESFGPVENCTGGTALDDNNTFFYFGGSLETTGFFGMMDDARLSTVSRSASEIEQSYLSGALTASVEAPAPLITNTITDIIDRQRFRKSYLSKLDTSTRSKNLYTSSLL